MVTPKPLAAKGRDGIRRFGRIPPLHIPPWNGVPCKNYIVRIGLHHIHTGIIDIRMEEGRQAVSTGGNGFGIVGGIPHISRLVRQTGENGNGQAGGNIVFACRRYAHLAQQRVGETEGHPLLIQPPGAQASGQGAAKALQP